MNPALLFWTGALVDLGLVCLVAMIGLRCVRRGEIARHRRAMKIAGLLIVAFLLAYVAKVVVIGREDFSLWSPLDLWVLRFHELFVLVMLVAGGLAFRMGGRLERTRVVTRDARDPDPDPKILRRHRRAGWIAVASMLAAFLLAMGVLAGMYARTTS